MIADAKEYESKVLRRRANGIMRMESHYILAFYEDQLFDTDRRIKILTAASKRKNR